MMNQMINSNTIAATGTRAEEILPPASIKAKVDETNNFVMDSMLAMQHILYAVSGIAYDFPKAEEDKCLHDATERLREDVITLRKWINDLETMLFLQEDA